MHSIKDFLAARSTSFVKLQQVRELGWQNTKGDEHFRVQRTRADGANPKQQRMFFNMMRQIGNQLQAATGALTVHSKKPQILDVCAAPGGFVSMALEHNPSADVYALSLPVSLGGHPLLVGHGKSDARVQVQFMDITRLGLEYGLKPEEMTADLISDRPFMDVRCDLAFCDGQLLRTNEKYRDSCLERHAASRLAYSQLIFSMSRIRPGGTIILLLHKAEAWHTLRLLASFSEFSTLQLFKPRKCHATRSSFYLVASNVQPSCAAAESTLAQWKIWWRQATFDPQGSTAIAKVDAPNDKDIKIVLDKFGDRFIELANPIWEIQTAAIEKASWFQRA